MALIKTCCKCGGRTDRPPYTQHQWIDYVCYKCGGGGARPGSYAPYIPKRWPRFTLSPTIIPKQSQSVFDKLNQSVRCVA